ncbi:MULTISPECIES: hypothetical protein [Cupriavidus]|nr:MULTISPECIES: hypothetical protein [Cupriavidus]
MPRISQFTLTVIAAPATRGTAGMDSRGQQITATTIKTITKKAIA